MFASSLSLFALSLSEVGKTVEQLNVPLALFQCAQVLFTTLPRGFNF